MSVAELAVSGFIAISVLLIIGVVAVIIAFTLRMGMSRDKRRASVEEARLVHEIYEGIQKMEERVNALETILLDRDKH